MPGTYTVHAKFSQGKNISQLMLLNMRISLTIFDKQFHNLSWITEINEFFHDILIYWDAPVHYYNIKC